MRKFWTAIILLCASSCPASPQKAKPKQLLPPAESHGMTISGYGCDRQYIGNTASTSKSISLWTLIVWAQYGEKHKKLWQKSYDTYQVPVKNTQSSNGESAGSGAAIGQFETKSYDFTSIDKGCAEWGAEVQSALKVESNGDKPK